MSGTWKVTALNGHLISRREDDLTEMNVYRQTECHFTAEYKDAIGNPRDRFIYDIRGDGVTVFIDRLHHVNGFPQCTVRFFGTIKRLGAAVQIEIERTNGKCNIPVSFHEVRDWRLVRECSKETGSC